MFIPPEFYRYFAVGLLGFMVDYGCYKLLASFFILDVGYLRFASMTLAITVCTKLHIDFTFKVAKSFFHCFRNFLLANYIGITVNFLIFYILIDEFGSFWSIFFSSCIAFIFNYFGAKYFAFR